mmetsp:Transcript_88664/g.248091  ORF Transcript_88664/g.248091 Transcript_88664/m.248091 type:complete len:208 (+) Transcript_88664:631-1254(+)
MFSACCCAERSSSLKALMPSFCFLISSNRLRYCVSPFRSVLSWILIFSYSKDSSSFRLMSWVPRMFRSLVTASNSLRWFWRSISVWRIVASSSLMACWFRSTTSCAFFCCLLWLSNFSLVFSVSFVLFCSWMCCMVMALSFSLISSFDCSIWWYMTLNFFRISAISSNDSDKFLEYKFLSVRTASYKFFCWLNLALTSAMLFFNWAM